MDRRFGILSGDKSLGTIEIEDGQKTIFLKEEAVVNFNYGIEIYDTDTEEFVGAIDILKEIKNITSK